MVGSCSHHLCLLQGWRQRHGRVVRDVRHRSAALQLDVTTMHSLFRCPLQCIASGEACLHTLADPLNRARAPCSPDLLVACPCSRCIELVDSASRRWRCRLAGCGRRVLSSTSRRVLRRAASLCMWTTAEAVRVSGNRPGLCIWAVRTCGRPPCRLWASQRVVSRALVSDRGCLVLCVVWCAGGMLGMSLRRSASKLLNRTLTVVGRGHILYISSVGLVVGGHSEGWERVAPQPSPRRLSHSSNE